MRKNKKKPIKVFELDQSNYEYEFIHRDNNKGTDKTVLKCTGLNTALEALKMLAKLNKKTEKAVNKLALNKTYPINSDVNDNVELLIKRYK